MANLISVTVYGSNQNDFKAGVVMAFPTNGFYLQTIPSTVYAGTACVTALYVLPNAPSPIQQIYYTSSTLSSLVSAANAPLVAP